MDKINQDLINQAISSQSSSAQDLQMKNEKERVKHERVMDRLWERMQEIYGHQLNSQYGATIPESWERLLMGVSPDQIKNGLERLATRTDTWPPNAVEFRQLCLPETVSPDGNNSAAYLSFNDERHPEHKQYSKAKRIEYASTTSKRKQIGKSELQKIKDML